MGDAPPDDSQGNVRALVQSKSEEKRPRHAHYRKPPKDADGRLLGEGECPHDALLVASKTAQLLFMGSSIAIVGLLFSFFMVTFRVNCDTSFRMASEVEVNVSGAWELCKTSPELKPLDISRLHDHYYYGVVTEIKRAPCHTADDCTEFSKGFCSAGRHQVNERGHCKEKGSACTCHSVIWDCGQTQSFELLAKIEDYVEDCTQEDSRHYCHHEARLIIPKYTKHRSDWIGCEYYHKTNINEAMQRVQESIREHGMTNTLKNRSDPVWENLTQYLSYTKDIRNDWFWPSTISESVASAMSPEQKIFVGFMLCSALSLFRSDYTTECRTVDLPHLMVPFIQLEWNTLRAWMPPIGLILLAFVEMVPTSEIYDLPHGLMTMVHLMGAQNCFAVYLLAEAVALWDTENVKEMTHKHEWATRAVLCGVGIISMAMFGVTYSILALFSGKGTCPYIPWFISGYSDMYERNSIDEVSHLVRPASGGWRVLKMVSYFAELTVALTILVSHLVIWWHFTSRLPMQFHMTKQEHEAACARPSIRGDRQPEESERPLLDSSGVDLETPQR